MRDNFDALNTELSETQTQILAFESRLHEINRDLASYDEAIKRLNADLALVNSDIRNNNDAARLQQEETFQQIYVPFANNIFKTICLMQKL